MTPLDVAKNIENKIYDLDDAIKTIKLRAEQKACAISEYEKVLAITILELKNGREKKLDDIVARDIPASLCEKIARGICWKEKLATDRAEALYKTAIVEAEIIQAQLNGWQSINRYLKEV